MSVEMQSAWTQLWKTGHFESLPEDRAAGRLASLDNDWKDFFAELPDRARLLDLATGGGDVIRGALALGRNFNITGVDLADLSAVSATLQSPDIELIGNTDISKLPFTDASFDGVASQFGIEYADIPAATHEAVRVLAPGGRGHFVLHHADSSITQGGSNSLAADKVVFTSSNAFELGRALFELHQRSAPEAEIVEAETAFRGAVSVLQPRIRNEPAFGPARNVVVFLMGLANAPGSLEAAEALHRLDAVEEQLKSRTLRKQAQIAATLDRRGMDRFAETLMSAGAVVNSPRELKYPGGRILGWSLSFSK